MSTTPDLDLGKLLRVRAMVIGAAQVQATHEAGSALVRAYLGLRDEIDLALQSDSLADLRGSTTAPVCKRRQRR